jgi:hypothetical protein
MRVLIHCKNSSFLSCFGFIRLICQVLNFNFNSMICFELLFLKSDNFWFATNYIVIIDKANFYNSIHIFLFIFVMIYIKYFMNYTLHQLHVFWKLPKLKVLLELQRNCTSRNLQFLFNYEIFKISQFVPLRKSSVSNWCDRFLRNCNCCQYNLNEVHAINYKTMAFKGQLSGLLAVVST